MHYKTKSLITISVMLVFMISISWLVHEATNPITGATTVQTESCDCTKDIDCNDNNPSTQDFCLYADECVLSLCINKPIN